MFSFFRLLFKNAYWRMLLRKATWGEAWASLKRVHKDRRARKHLYAIAVMVLAPAVCAAYVAWLVGSGAVFLIPFVIPVLWLIRRRNRREDPAQLSLSAPPQPVHHELSESEQAEIRNYLSRLALGYAVFLDRAASEAFLKRNTLPEGHQVVSRRIHLELLRNTGVWDRLTQSDREAMIAADGNWDWTTINRIALAIEPVRLLRWILRLDFYLPLIGKQLQVDSRLAHELVEQPGKVLEGRDLASVEMMQTGLNSARQFVVRCVAELIARGVHEPANEEMREWATKASSAVSGDQNEDLLIDGQLVSESPEDRIRWAASLSQKRADFLKWTIDLVEGSTPLAPEFPAILTDK